MDLAKIKKAKLPDVPGVYFFKKGKKVLYVGKATSLKSRVLSYFNDDLIKTRGPRIVDMVSLSDGIDYKKTDSVLEAVIAEATFIKKIQPIYNVQEKDDKSFNYLVTTAEEFPRVLLVRGRDLEHGLEFKIRKTFGPFPYGSELKEAMKLVKKIFPFFNTPRPISVGSDSKIKREALRTQMGIYPDILSGKVSKQEYLKTIRNIELLFSDKKQEVIRSLKREMKEYSKKLEFEEAEKIKRTLFALEHIRDVSMIKEELNKKVAGDFRIEAYDIAHLAGREMVGVMTVLENSRPKKSEYRKFNIKSVSKANDTGALAEVLERRFKHSEWSFPNLVVIDGGKAQINIAERILKEIGLAKIPIVSVLKDEKHKPKIILGSTKISVPNKKEILIANSEAHRFAIGFHRQKSRRRLF